MLGRGLGGGLLCSFCMLCMLACAPDAAEPGSGSSATGTATSTAGASTAGASTVGATALDEDSGPRLPALLVDHAAWMPLAAGDDPLPSHRPAEGDCGPVGAHLEGTGYEIETAACNYCARWQPSQVEIRAGDTLAISAFHETLASIEAGQAHMALLLGSWPVWQEFIPIPASPGVVDATPFSEQLVIDIDVPAGTPVVLHLHNHGYNSWTLLDVEVRPAEGG
ncbi:MAG: hypothetical protein KDK70_32000 [Myxococcales bacterium]|nr:hypothetical protein [Myxococcales bacterium]